MNLKNILVNNLILIIIALLIGCFFTYYKINTPVEFKIELVVETKEKNKAIQFYCHTNHIYQGKTRVDSSYNAQNQVNPNQYKLVNKIQCGNKATNLRFDPLPADGIVSIVSMRIHTNYWHNVDLAEAMKHIKPINSIEKIHLDDKKITIISAGEDPYIELSDNLQSYLKNSTTDLLQFFLKYSVISLILLTLITKLLSTILVNGPTIHSFLQSKKTKLDQSLKTLLGAIANLMSAKIKVNGLIVVIGFILYLVSSYIFSNHLISEVSTSYAMTFLFIAIQFVIIYFLYVVLLRIFGNYKLLRAMIGFVFLLSQVFIAADVSLFSLNGMHIQHGLGMLTDGGFSQFFNNLRFTQLSNSELTVYLTIIFSSLIICFAAVWLAEFRIKKHHYQSSVHKTLVLTVAGMLLVYVLQATSANLLNNKQIITYQHHHPIGVSFFSVNENLLSFVAAPKPFLHTDLTDKEKQSVKNNTINNIYLFIFESIREDVVSQEVTPNLIEFKNNAWHFEQSVASGNATHYGWYSIVNAKQPFYWERYKRLNDKKGSVPLQIFKSMGYKINVYSAKDLSYLQSDQIMFGEDLKLADMISPHPKMSPPEHDRRVINDLITDIGNSHKKSKNFNIIYLDSSHYPYRWNQSEIDEITPYQGTPSEGTDLSHAKRLIKKDKHLIFNRYKNSIKYMDYLFGQMMSALDNNNMKSSSMVIAVGDHGQQFMEHDYMLHGFTLFNEDIQVPLYFQAPGLKAEKDTQVASQVDIMPTILNYLKINTADIKQIDGQSLLQPGLHKYKLSSVAGEQNTPTSFVLSSLHWKLYFKTQRNNPTNFNKIFITQITDNEDIEYIPGKGLKEDYRAFINKEFPEFIKHTTIFK